MISWIRSEGNIRQDSIPNGWKEISGCKFTANNPFSVVAMQFQIKQTIDCLSNFVYLFSSIHLLNQAVSL